MREPHLQHVDEAGLVLLLLVVALERVRGAFPETLLLAREAIAWGTTDDVLTPENLHRARYISDGWSDAA